MGRIKKLFIIFFCVGTHPVIAQNFTSSPYSRFGVGEIHLNSFSKQKGMANIANGLRDPNATNIINPASYTAIALTTFEIGGYSKIVRINNATNSQVNFNSSLSYLSLAFPVAKRWSSAFGLIPFSERGYKVKLPIKDQNFGTVNQIFEGRGGVNQFFIGNAYRIHKNISLGLNVAYLFGDLIESKSTEYNDTLAYFNVRRNDATYISDFYTNYGVQYFKDLKNDLKLVIGYSGAWESKLNAKRNILTERYIYNAIGDEVLVDTVEITPNDKGSFTLPTFHSVGFSLSKTNKWLVGGDISLGEWANFRKFEVDPKLKNTFELNIGGQVTPDYNAVRNYFKQIDYRLGLNYGRSYIYLKGQHINQYGLTVGLGLPLPKSNSKINLAVELGQRGTTTENLIREDYLNIHFGVVFSDKWFIKRRYD